MRTSTVKTVVIFLLSGAIFGAVIASLIAPALYSWVATPGAGTQEIVTRVSVIREATNMLFKAQGLGAGIGGLLGLVSGVLVARALGRRANRKLQSTSPAATGGAPVP